MPTICPIKTPTTSPHAYPIATTFQSNSNAEFEPWFSLKVEGGCGEELTFSHLFDNGFPHNPELPSYEPFWNVSNCLPRGIGPTRELWETLTNARKLSSVSFGGISPYNLFLERSKDSSSVMLPKDGGIWPVRALFERLSKWRAFRFPISSGISLQIDC